MNEEPYVICGVINGALKLLEQKWGLDRQPLLVAAGLENITFEDYDKHVPLNSFAIVLEEAAKVTGDESLVLKLTSMFDEVTEGLINKYVTMSAPTLGEALAANARYSNLIFCARKGGLIVEGDIATLSWSYWKGFGGMQQFPNWIPGPLITLMRKSLGPVWFPVSVKLEHAAPLNVAPFKEAFGPNLHFNQAVNSIALKKSDLIYPMPKSDKKLWKYLISLADDVLQKQGDRSDIITAIQKIIIEALPRDEANIKYISEKLGKSPRTLQRELTSVGTSFSRILEQTRQELADKYLLDSDLHISQITFLLGFSEVSVFTRAANRWFGLSPSMYRQKNKHQKRA